MGYNIALSRSVAQSGSAPGLGPGGPRFESLYSDHFQIASLDAQPSKILQATFQELERELDEYSSNLMRSSKLRSTQKSIFG